MELKELVARGFQERGDGKGREVKEVQGGELMHKLKKWKA